MHGRKSQTARVSLPISRSPLTLFGIGIMLIGLFEFCPDLLRLAFTAIGQQVSREMTRTMNSHWCRYPSMERARRRVDPPSSR